MLVALVVALFVVALPTQTAFGEGSADTDTGPGDARRNVLSGATAGHTVLKVYARAGETIQLASSANGLADGNILVYPPGTNASTTSVPGGAVWDCQANDPGTGFIGSRAAELAGPEPSAAPAAYTPCEFVATQDGVYEVIMLGPDPSTTNGGGGTVDVPITESIPALQQGYVELWDITVRDAADVKLPGRVFSDAFILKSTFFPGEASTWESYVYTRTGYEYRTTLDNPAGLNWVFRADNVGLVNPSGEQLFASQENSVPRGTAAGFQTHALFVNPVDPTVITGPGGLGATLNYEAAPITPASDPLRNIAFTGSAGQASATQRGSGGTISFTSPAALDDSIYTAGIDLNRDGVFGNDNDVADTLTLNSAGNSFTWDGKDAAGATPPCGSYPYEIRTTLSEVHFVLADMEGFGGMTIERLTLPTDPSLPGPFAASYNDISPASGNNVSGASPAAVTNGDSSVPGFHSWAYPGGDNDYIDTYSRLPEIVKTGTFDVKCTANMTIEKTASDGPVTVGEPLTYTLTVRNAGPDPALNPTVTDPVPGALDARSVSTSRGDCSLSGNNVSCTLGPMAVGETATIRVRTVAQRAGTVTNTARVAEERCPANPCDTDPVRRKIVKPKLKLTKKVGKKVLRAGETTNYRIRVSNPSEVRVRRVRTCDRLPAGLVFVSATPKAKLSNGRHCWTVKRLAAGKSRTYKVTVRALAGTNQSTRLVNRATATSPDARAAQARRAVRVISDPPVTPSPTG